jgi:hypothetical protein
MSPIAIISTLPLHFLSMYIFQSAVTSHCYEWCQNKQLPFLDSVCTDSPAIDPLH